MIFKVIYSFDCNSNYETIKSLRPPKPHKWDLTEKDECYEMDYLGGAWKKGKHRKYCAYLNKQDFNDFINNQSLHMEDVETMGMIDVDGHFPAMSFRGEVYDCLKSAYVWPLSEFNPKNNISEEREEKYWGLLYKVMLKKYGY